MVEGQKGKAAECWRTRPLLRLIRTNRNPRGSDWRDGKPLIRVKDVTRLLASVQGGFVAEFKEFGMSITFCKKYTAEGPYTDRDSLKDNSGVYVILTRPDAASKWTVIDVGESATVKKRVEDHERKDCWTRHSKGVIGYSPYYMPHKQQSGRMEVEQEIRDEYNPPCGKR